jgi:hypothetical protein
MGMHRHCGAGWNTSIENSDPIVFEQDCVKAWRGNHGVKIIGPRPGVGHAVGCQRDEAFRIDVAV